MLTASYAINIILGLPANVYILWLILTGAGGTMASEFFALNLTVSEILFCLFNAVRIAELQSDKYVHSNLVHKAASFSFGLIFSGRPLFQCCICLQRYLAVVHPVVFLKYKPLRYKVGCCSVVWLMVLGSCCLSLLETLSPMFFYSVLGQSLIYFLLMSFCCLSVLWALKRPGPGDGDREGTNSIKMKAFKLPSHIRTTRSEAINTSTPATNYSIPEDPLAGYFYHIKSISTASLAINIILGLPM
eukprot:XP_014065307.1 PREDICTED: proteinase-activated receptor 3-like [Salmo salar]